MASYPGRDFVPREIIRYVLSRGNYDVHCVRAGVARVLAVLVASGIVLRKPPRVARGGAAMYGWK